MRPAPEVIRLGTHEWLVRPLTLRQVQEIEPVLIPSATDAKGNVTAAIDIVTIALKRDFPVAAASLVDIEATAQEVGAAMATVLRLGGFIDAPKDGDNVPGESQAGRIDAMDRPA